MKFQKKLKGYFLGVALLSSSLGLSIVYVDYKKRATLSMRERIIDVSATTASLLSPSLVKSVISGGTENSEQYKELISKLRSARNANRGSDWYVISIYLMTRSPSDPSQVIFIADSEENDVERVHFGEVDEQETYSHINQHLLELYSPEGFITDTWGTWMSGFAPILDDKGQYVATIGADVSVHMIDERLNEILLIGLWGLLGSIFIAIISARIASKRLSFALGIVNDGVKKIAEGNLSTVIELHSDDEIEELSLAINDMARGLKEKDKMKQSFARYVSQHVLDSIATSGSVMKSEGERRKITILFTDIRQFTLLSEHIAPELIVALLNEYFSSMIDIIFKYGGTLDKFLGDGMMIEFGAPMEDPTQELHAVQAAIEMQQKIRSLCRKWRSEGKPEISMGIGIHTGYAVIGLIGSEKRVEYTAIGDTVNVASRLEKATKQLDVSILLSSSTYEAVKTIFSCKSLGPISIAGREQEVEVYTVSVDTPLGDGKQSPVDTMPSNAQNGYKNT